MTYLHPYQKDSSYYIIILLQIIHSTEYQNNFVRVQVISQSVSINCTFLNELEGTPKSCNATITYGDNCQDQMLINGIKDSENDLLIVISLRRFLEETMSSKYCGFRVNATANTTTVTVEGNLLGKSSIQK